MSKCIIQRGLSASESGLRNFSLFTGTTTRMNSLFRLVPVIAILALSGCNLAERISGKSDNQCAGPTPYTAGTTVTGTLGVNNCASPTGGKGQLYAVTLSQQSNLRFTVASSAFTPLIALYRTDGGAIAEELGSNVVKAFLPPGTYKLFVARTSNNDGPFTLSSPSAPLGGPCSSSTGTLASIDMGFTMKGAQFTGTLTGTDCGAANAKMHWYRIRLASGDTLHASLSSDQPAGFSLVNTTGAMTRSKELTAAGTWSTTYIATADGTITLRLESRASGTGTGLPLHYTVSLQ